MPDVIPLSPRGLTYTQVINIVAKVWKRASIGGFDLVEFYPPADLCGLTALTAARLIVNVIGQVSRQRWTNGDGPFTANRLRHFCVKKLGVMATAQASFHRCGKTLGWYPQCDIRHTKAAMALAAAFTTSMRPLRLHRLVFPWA